MGLTIQEYRAIDDAHGSAGIAGAELLLAMREQRKSPALPFTQPSAAGRSSVRSDLPRIGPVFTCSYDSECGRRGDDLVEGSRARMVDGEATHEECAETGEESHGQSDLM